MTVQYDTKSPWRLLFHFRGSIWSTVLPYCVLNCTITGLIVILRNAGVRITFSAQGHALMSVVVSYLVVSKVYLAFDRYMEARCAAGRNLATLRELNQAALCFTARMGGEKADGWRVETRNLILELLKCTLQMLKDEQTAVYLARAEDPPAADDPISIAQALRLHFYVSSDPTLSPSELHILEKSKMLDLLHDYNVSYRDLLKLASTPLPFPLIQMGRTFLFLWTFTIPFALVGIVDEIVSVTVFVFFLTYGFVGMEFVTMKMLHPFGDALNDLNVSGMGRAVAIGIDHDVEAFQRFCKKQGPYLGERGGFSSGGSSLRSVAIGGAGALSKYDPMFESQGSAASLTGYHRSGDMPISQQHDYHQLER